MKIVMLCTTRIVPGKMSEYMELEKKMFEISNRVGGMPSFRRLNLMSGKGDIQHTVVYLMEFDSFAAMDGFTKAAGDAEMQALMPNFDSVMETHEHDVYMETPMPWEHGRAGSVPSESSDHDEMRGQRRSQEGKPTRDLPSY